MEEFFYAQVDQSGVCFSVTQTAGEVTEPGMVRIQEFDPSLLGRLWLGDAWAEFSPEPSS